MKLPVIAYDTASRRRVLGGQRTYFGSYAQKSVAPPPTALSIPTPGPSSAQSQASTQPQVQRDILRLLTDRNIYQVLQAGHADPGLLKPDIVVSLGEVLFLGRLDNHLAQRAYLEWRRLIQQPQDDFWFLACLPTQRVRYASLAMEFFNSLPPALLVLLVTAPAFSILPLVVTSDAQTIQATIDVYHAVVGVFLRSAEHHELYLRALSSSIANQLLRKLATHIHLGQVLSLFNELFSTAPNIRGQPAPIASIVGILVRQGLVQSLMGIIIQSPSGTEHLQISGAAEFILTLFVTTPPALQKALALELAPLALRCCFRTEGPSSLSLRLKYSGQIAVVCLCVLLSLLDTKDDYMADYDQGDGNTSLVAVKTALKAYTDSVTAFAKELKLTARVTLPLMTALHTVAMLLSVRATPMNLNESFYNLLGMLSLGSNAVRLSTAFASGTDNPFVSGFSIPTRFAADKTNTRFFMSQLTEELASHDFFSTLMNMIVVNPTNSVLQNTIAQILLNVAILGYYSAKQFRYVAIDSGFVDRLQALIWKPPMRRSVLDIFYQRMVLSLFGIVTGATETHYFNRAFSKISLLNNLYRPEHTAIVPNSIQDIRSFAANMPNDTRAQLIEVVLGFAPFTTYSKNILEHVSLTPVMYDDNHRRFLQQIVTVPQHMANVNMTTAMETGAERAQNWRANTPIPRARWTPRTGVMNTSATPPPSKVVITNKTQPDTTADPTPVSRALTTLRAGAAVSAATTSLASASRGTPGLGPILPVVSTPPVLQTPGNDLTTNVRLQPMNLPTSGDKSGFGDRLERPFDRKIFSACSRLSERATDSPSLPGGTESSNLRELTVRDFQRWHRQSFEATDKPETRTVGTPGSARPAPLRGTTRQVGAVDSPVQLVGRSPPLGGLRGFPSRLPPGTGSAQPLQTGGLTPTTQYISLRQRPVSSADQPPRSSISVSGRTASGGSPVRAASQIREQPLVSFTGRSMSQTRELPRQQAPYTRSGYVEVRRIAGQK